MYENDIYVSGNLNNLKFDIPLKRILFQGATISCGGAKPSLSS